jgi:hypothetical protein
MNPADPHNQPWSRLVAGARRANEERDAEAPYGFSTRMAALAMAQESRAASVFDRFALRALGIACVLALLSLAVNYPALQSDAGATAMAYDETAVADDGMAIVMEMAAD